MGITRHEFRDQRLVVTHNRGEITDAELRAYVVAYNRATVDLPDFREIIDCRDMVIVEDLSVSGTTDGAGNLANRPDVSMALVIADSSLQLGMARAFQAIAADRRRDTEIFTDPHHALRWLYDDEHDLAALAKLVELARETT